VNTQINLGVIVPFYNEQKFLDESVSRLLKIDIIEQIILVDDCSSDNSYSIAKNMVNNNSNISLTQTQQNGGKGAAVQKGLELIKTSHVIVHDADLEYFPEDIIEMFDKVTPTNNTLILGSRTLGSKERTNLYYYTYFGNKVLSLLFSILNNRKISDIASCYWLVSVKSLKEINLQEKGFAIEVEVLSKFIRSKTNIIEVPIKYMARSYEEGKKITLKDGFAIFLKILKYCKLNFFI
jgi:glycosyltransferase involved in cell wall biosynthesis